MSETTVELRRKLKAHEKYDKWWNSLPLEKKQAIFNPGLERVVVSSPTDPTKHPLYEQMEGGPKFKKGE